MIQVLVLDACCLIDSRKGGLLPVLAKPPYRLLVPLPVRRDEVLNFNACDWHQLDAGGLETFDLPPAAVAEAMALREQYPRLSAHDCFCLCTTRGFASAILITGDWWLRRVAVQQGLCVHGVLWITDQLRSSGVGCNERLIAALACWRDDPTVFLPQDEIDHRLHDML